MIDCSLGIVSIENRRTQALDPHILVDNFAGQHNCTLVLGLWTAGNLINLDKSTIFVKRDQVQMFFCFFYCNTGLDNLVVSLDASFVK